MIDKLEEGQVFTFGSNLKGDHLGAAAHQAFENFGAIWGVGEGLTGDSYAFPTLDENMARFETIELLSIREAFYRCCRAHPELTFLLTPVGTGIAGYGRASIEMLFEKLPPNVKKVGWNV